MLVPVSKTITVTTSGTPVSLFASGAIPSNVVSVHIQAQANTILVGDSTVSYTATPKVGISRASTDVPYVIENGGLPLDPKAIYIDASTNATVVNVLYFKKV